MLRSTLNRVRDASHERRLRLLLDLIRVPEGARVLDLGSGWWSPFSLRLRQHVPVHITLADVYPPTHPVDPSCDVVLLTAGEPLPFRDGEFDLVLCNSVIEHVTPADRDLGDADWRRTSWELQQAFAAEIRRVGRGYFVQTPHRHFPLDLHMWLPFTNWLPHPAVSALVPWTNRFWVKKNHAADWSLLDTADMRRLFPGARVLTENALGWPRSVVAVGSPPPAGQTSP